MSKVPSSGVEFHSANRGPSGRLLWPALSPSWASAWSTPSYPALSKQLQCVSKLGEFIFTSYLVVTAVAMLVTGWVSSRIGSRRTLIIGLTLIVVF